jgi:peptide subunit release factor 1 (eRF1)
MTQDIKRKRLEALIKELEKIRGRHTELVTVYVPAG